MTLSPGTEKDDNIEGEIEEIVVFILLLFFSGK
jgi:hypothetical protein